MKNKILLFCALALTCSAFSEANAAEPTETERSCARFKTLITESELAPFFKGRAIELKIEPVDYSPAKGDSTRCAIRVLNADKSPDDGEDYQLFWAAVSQFKQARAVFEKNKRHFLSMNQGSTDAPGKLSIPIKSMTDSITRGSGKDMVDVLTTRGDTAYFYMDDSEKLMGQTNYHKLIKTIVDKLDSPAFDSLRKRSNPAVL